MNLTTEFKEKVRIAMLEARANYGGSDSDFARTKGIKPSIYSRLKSGETDRLLSDTVWITLGRELNVKVYEDNWKVARTQVYSELEDNLSVCKETSTAMVFVDDCGIGKTFCTRHIIKKMKNTFYIDCSQSKTKQVFIRALAKAVGIEAIGRYVDVKANLKYCLTNLEKPLVVLDEAGDLDYNAFLELKELWNGTEGACGWYMIGAEGLRAKINAGIDHKKVGYAEIFDRYSEGFIQLVPVGKEQRDAFYKELIYAVASANVPDQKRATKLVFQCMNNQKKLRHLNTLIKMGA